MGSEQFPLHQSGIYRNLPTFDPSIVGLKALVVGATGISGFSTIRALLDSPQRWATVFALSRSPPTPEMLSLLTREQQGRIQHVSVDLTGSAEQISASLQKAKVEADHVFFYGYIHPKGKSAMDPTLADTLVETNVPIFENFIGALSIAKIEPKRILLQTGGKNYGGHIGRSRLPFVESDPQPRHLTNNFYHKQEEILFRFCEQNPGTDWNIIMPFAIIGAVPNAGMNSFAPFAIVAAVEAEKDQPIHFPGDIEEWQYELCHSSAKLTGYISEWAVLEERCKNQRFNAQDGSPLSWDRFFSELARWYGVSRGVVGPDPDESQYHEIVLAGGRDCPLGYGPPKSIRLSRSFQDWAEDDNNHQAWQTISLLTYKDACL